jgi:hypothetical protein
MRREQVLSGTRDLRRSGTPRNLRTYRHLKGDVTRRYVRRVRRQQVPSGVKPVRVDTTRSKPLGHSPNWFLDDGLRGCGRRRASG